MSPRESQAIARLQDLCRIPSVSSDPENVARAAEWILQAYGPGCDLADVLRDESGNVLGLILAFGPPGVNRLTFYNYIDVAPPGTESEWARPPFSAEIDQGRVYARGTASNKGDLVARLEAVCELQAKGELRREVVFWIDAAEEAGSPGLLAMLERWSDQLAACLVVWNTGFVNRAGEPVVGCGFKGVLIVRLTARSDSAAGHSGIGFGSSAIHTLLEVVDPLLREEDLGELLPQPGVSDQLAASVRLVAEAGIVDGLGRDLPAQAETRAAQRGTDGRIAKRALLESTANVPWFSGGRPDELTRYAPSATCALEIRLVAPHRPGAALEALAARCAAKDVICETLMQVEPYSLEPEARTAVLAVLGPPLEEAFGTTARLLPIVPFSAHALEVSRALDALVASVGLTDLDSAPHAANESVSCDLFLRTIEFARRLVAA